MLKVEIEAERIWGRRTSHIKRFQLAGTHGRQLSMSTRSRIKSTSCICVLIFLLCDCDFFSQKKKNIFNPLSHEKDGTLIWTSPINYASGSLSRKIFVFIVLFCSGLRCPILVARCTRVGWNLVVRSPARVEEWKRVVFPPTANFTLYPTGLREESLDVLSADSSWRSPGTSRGQDGRRPTRP